MPILGLTASSSAADAQKAVATILSRMCKLALSKEHDAVRTTVDDAADRGFGMFGGGTAETRLSARSAGELLGDAGVLGRVGHVAEHAMALMRLLVSCDANDFLLTPMASTVLFRRAAPEASSNSGGRKSKKRAANPAAAAIDFTLAHALVATATTVLHAVLKRAPSVLHSSRRSRRGGDDDYGEDGYDDENDDDEGDDDDDDEYGDDEDEDRLFRDQDLVFALLLQLDAAKQTNQGGAPSLGALVERLRAHVRLWREAVPQSQMLSDSVHIMADPAREGIFGGR